MTTRAPHQLITIDGEVWTIAALRDEMRRLRKGHCRQCHGCIHRPALEPHQIADIRERARPGHGGNIRELAEQYGVTARTILRYLSGERGRYWLFPEAVA